MRRLLLMLSCLLSLSLSSCKQSYKTSHVATLEELDEYNAMLNLKDSSKVVKVKLADTLDCYSKTPLKAEGQRVILYNSNYISQVDQKVIYQQYLHNVFHFLVMLFIAGLIFCIFCVVDPSQILIICINIFYVGAFLLHKYTTPSFEIVSYGKVISIDKVPNSNIQEIVIEKEDNEQEYYQISSLKFSLPDDKMKGAEGLIYKTRDGYGLYSNQGQSKGILEATLKYSNEKYVSMQNLLRNLMYIHFAIAMIFYIYRFFGRMKAKKLIKAQAEQMDRIEKKRAKLEEEILRQEEFQHLEYLRNCEMYVNEFWQDFLDSSESTNVLLARLKLKLEKSGYENWQKDFYADVEKKAKAYQRPSQEQRQKASSQDGDFSNFGDLLIDFNGVFVTPVQYQILSKNSKARNLSRAQVLELCRKLAKTRPEFASFKEERGIQPYVAKGETNEAFRLFGLTKETLNAESLKQAYRRLVQKYHPDRNREPNAVVMFQKVQRYYAYLEGLARS